MRNFKKVALVVLPFTILLSVNAQDVKPVEVMVLGMYHMNNPNADAANVKADDVKTPKRQKELKDLVLKLAQFNPSKILIEAPYGSESIVNEFKDYLKNQEENNLGHDEIYQVGYRLASYLNHESIYPVDFIMNGQPASMNELFQNNPDKAEYMTRSVQKIQETIDHWTEDILYKSTITEYLIFMNSKEIIDKNYALYLEFTRELWDEDNYSGAEMLALWHERNIKIFQNIIRVTNFDDPKERLLVIIGQGHSKILKDLFEDAPYYTDVDVLKYLSQ